VMADVRMIGLAVGSAAAAAVAFYLFQRKVPSMPGEGIVTTNDGINLHYVVHGCASSKAPVVLIHGWSGSLHYFSNTAYRIAAATGGIVYSFDLRFHGKSDKPAWGFHVHRLAADLHNLLEELQLEKPVVVGTSLGCAIIWAYVELYGDDSLGKCVFVDQAPSQWTFPDWKCGSKGIYDPKSLANIQAALFAGMEAFAAGNAECCLSHTLPAPLAAILAQETLLCEPEHLAKLMADHAPRDWRPVLRRISRPCLNLFGTDSGCFPIEGTRAVGELIPDCENVEFSGFNHWLYLESPERFSRLVAEFALRP